MYFAYGWPRVLSGIAGDAQKDIVFSTLTDQYLVLVSTSAVQIWSGGAERVKLGTLTKSPKAVEDEGVNFKACWNESKNILAVLTSENILQLYSVHKTSEELLPGVISQFGRNHILKCVDIYLSADVHIEPSLRATDLVSDSMYILVSLSDGRLMLFSWQGTSKGYADPLTLSQSPKSGGLSARQSMDSPWNWSDLSRGGSLAASMGNGVPRSGAMTGSKASSLLAQASNISEASAISGASYVDSEFGELMSSLGGMLGGECCHIWHMDYSEKLKMIAIVLLDGRVALCRTSQHGLSPPDQIKLVRWVCGPASGALFACIGARAQTVAIGCANGQVALYSLTQGKAKSKKARMYAPPTRVLSLVDWGHKSHSTGGVCFMQWSPDCRALAVGWRKQGMAVWSPSGCRLVCSLRQKNEPVGMSRHESFNGTVSPTISGTESMHEAETPYEPLEGGIATMCWGPEGYQLLVAERDRPWQLMEISFAKTIDGDHRVPRVDVGDSSRLQDEEVNVLQGADRLLLITESQDAVASSNWSQWNVGGQEVNQLPEDLVVRHLRVPAAYMASNWPLIHAAVSADGYDIAAAGSRGLCLYSRRSGKWRLFGDVSQERSIYTMAVIWLPKIVVACAQIEGGYSAPPAELLLYPRYHLDNASLLGRYALPTVPLALDAVGHYLLVACAPLDIMVLRVDVKGELVPLATPTITITLLRELSIMSMGYQLLDIALVAATTTELLLNHIRPQRESESDSGETPRRGAFHKRQQSMCQGLTDGLEPTHCVVLRAGGLLSVLDMERGSEVLLDNCVECFWLSGAILGQELNPRNVGTLTSASSHAHSTSSTALANLASRQNTAAVNLSSSGSPLNPSATAVVSVHPPEETSGAFCSERKTKRSDLQINVAATTAKELQPIKTGPSTPQPEDDDAEYAAVEMPWWAYGSRGMQLWYPSSIAEPSSPATVGTSAFHASAIPDPELEFDREVYPVGISLADAAIVGVTQRMQKSRPEGPGTPLTHANYPLFQPVAESQPVLPCLLRRLLQKGAFDEAVVLARRHARGHYFPRSLEWLLFTSLEVEHELERKARKEQQARAQLVGRTGSMRAESSAMTRNNSGNVYAANLKLMRKAVKLIRLFPQYSDVVVSVARKTDASLWPLLYSAVGSPGGLVEGLMEKGALQSAACCLLCVDRLEGSDKAQALSLQILEDALEGNQYNLAMELLRFLIPPTESDSIFDSIDADTQQADSVVHPPNEVRSPFAALAETEPQQPQSAGWLSWMFYGSQSGAAADPMMHRGSCAAVLTRPLTVVAPPRPLPEARPVSTEAAVETSPDSSDTQAGITAWISMAQHARGLLGSGNIRPLAALGRALAALGGGLPRLLVAARKHTGAPHQSVSNDPANVDLLTALACVHSEVGSALSDPDVMADVALLHEACYAAGYISWAVGFATILEHAPTLKELKTDFPQTWEEYRQAVRREPSFQAYWRLFDEVNDEAASPGAR